ncbi:hypothetical protein [Pseudomonas huanghezhanensis]|uniref:hypothetical protein n=1 Tax=Pseudomonas huanghezhanensis TaxID=3002903 RepID=UPI002285644E|nr:hypothetical protein [Pseudomonas sp. BSw22131]
MRSILMTSSLFLFLAGCGSTPNNPSVTLDTQKSPADYAACVFPKWQKAKPDATLTESKGHYRILVPSKVAADEILEVYKGNPNTRVFIYQRVPLSGLLHGKLETAARDCL